MSEALDRAAKALAMELYDQPNVDVLAEMMKDVARAVILSIRDPTPEMKEAMRICATQCGRDVNRFVCEAMFKAAIDEVLK